MTTASQRAIGVAVLLLPGLAQAHLVSTGLGPIYDGIGHFFLSVESLLPMVTLLVLAGLGTTAQARQRTMGLVVAWLVGAAVGLLASSIPAEPLISLMPALTMLGGGIMIAINAQRPAWPVMLGVLVGGALLGFSEGQVLRAFPDASLLALGTLLSVLVLVSLVPATTIAMASGPEWRRLVLRVMGSWLAGIGLLLVGWSWRYGGAG